MKIHHLNYGSMRLIETDRDGLVLVETGLGLGDVRDPAGALGAAWVEMTQAVLDEDETAARQIAHLGYTPDDVRHVIVTHLDVDHCGGLPDFPDAQVHVLAAELEAALAEAPSFRYRPAHWAHGPKWVTYPQDSGQKWFGLPSIQPHGLPPEIQLVPLSGHTAGHMGVAVHDSDRWLLHCGDAYYFHRELDPTPEPHPVLDVVQTRSETDHDLRVGTQAKLRELPPEVELFSAHDPWELARYR